MATIAEFCHVLTLLWTASSVTCQSLVESFNGRLSDERLNEHLFGTEAWRIQYNTNRPRTSLDGLTSLKFATHLKQGHKQNRL